MTPEDYADKKNINMGAYWTNDYSRKKSTSNLCSPELKLGFQIQQHLVVT